MYVYVYVSPTVALTLRCRFRGTSKYFSELGKNGPFLAVSYPRLLFASISIESR